MATKKLSGTRQTRGIGIFALVYSGSGHADVVIPLAGGLYAVGLGYYLLWGRKHLQAAAPEELGARSVTAVQKEVCP